MQYLITNLWKLPSLARSATGQDAAGESSSQENLLAAACRDCGQYNFPPKGQCRYCGSPRTRMVSVSHDQGPNPGTWVFDAEAAQKPN
ncbi:MAG: zinc ribbon domain-containing protein [Persicimonas sp.]